MSDQVRNYILLRPKSGNPWLGSAGVVRHDKAVEMVSSEDFLAHERQGCVYDPLYVIGCRVQGSNPRPPDYKSGALPSELTRQFVRGVASGAARANTPAQPFNNGRIITGTSNSKHRQAANATSRRNLRRRRCNKVQTSRVPSTESRPRGGKPTDLRIIPMLRSMWRTR